MRRRDFLKKAGLATAGAITIPYILPSGRLFAATGARKANHIVFCLFGGGVRNIESMQKSEGNLMPNMLNGREAISSDILGAMDPLPALPLPMPLQNYGTLFTQFKYAKGPIGHFNAHTCALTGVYTTTDLSIQDHPQTPTIFELYKKHNYAAATKNAWWISNTLGLYPALIHSHHQNYGELYGANFSARYPDLSGSAIAHDADNFSLLSEASSFDNTDTYNISFAEGIIPRFEPELVVVNMQEMDICHHSFTGYCNNLRKADYAVAHLWNTIQSTPGMVNDTILIVAPDHGRNLKHNSIADEYGRNGLDHATATDLSGDQTARDIFCLVVGPPNIVKQGQVIDASAGESIEIVPTIANILGFEKQIPVGIVNRFSECEMQAAFV